MKTFATLDIHTFLTKAIVSLLLVLITMSCSNDDDQAPLEIIKSAEKELIGFKFLAADNSVLTSNVVAVIDATNKTILATLPIDTPLNNLTPILTVSEKATASPTGLQDFSNPVTFTIVAEDSSSTNYTTTITRELSEKGILQLILEANPENTLGWNLPNTIDLGNLNGVIINTQNSIVELDLPNKNLNELPKEIGQLANLEKLSLATNNLSALPKEIGLLSKLEILELGENNLSSLPIEIGLLSNLRVLRLSVNQLSTLPIEISQLVNLSELYLNSNQLTAIPSEIGALTKLLMISLGSNQLRALPKEIGEISSLIGLYLNNNQIEAIPEEIGQLTNLEFLLLNNNQLTSIPPELGFLTNLESLRMTDNNLNSIPQSVINLIIFNNPSMSLTFDTDMLIETSQQDALIGIYSSNPGNNLEWGVDNFPEVSFDADGNPITITMNNKNLTRLPLNISQLSSLESLNVNANNLTSLPATLATINTLNTITAANNELSTIPSEFGLMDNLTLLSITQNPITTIPQEVCDLQTSNGGILTILADLGEGCE